MQKPSLSVYIHIPFCKSKCRYCDFYSIRYNNDLADKYIDALAEEWKLICEKEHLQNHNIVTLYFGGGTPSILSTKQWIKIEKVLISQFNMADSLEWSVECNPESFNAALADVLYQLGVNRLTFGIQSLIDKELSISGRVHDSSTASNVLNDNTLSMFRSVGADLIYGLPGQTILSLKESVSEMLKSKFVKHISAYELTINENTPFGRHKRILPLPDEDTVFEMTTLVRTILKESGFEQYEISNFAKPGFQSRHNEIYWDHKNYIGLGCSSHSYLHPYRWANQEDVTKYINRISKRELPSVSREFIDQDKLAHEMLFLGLRRAIGIDENEFEKYVGRKFRNLVNTETLEQYIARGWLVYNEPRYTVTESGLLFADTMARELF